MHETQNLPLLLAVLNRAAQDVANGLMCSTREKREALCWITNWDNSDYAQPFSYPWICEHLNLEPARTRDIILDFAKAHKGTHVKGKKRSFYTGRGNSINRVIEAIFDLHYDCLGHTITIIYK